MTQHLFVYGTLAPGRPNEHVLADLEGSWQPATARGHLNPEGWGAEMGYPGLVIDASGEEVEGFVFSSDQLDGYWATLDAFEGEEYQRVSTEVRVRDGRSIEAQVYVVRLGQSGGDDVRRQGRSRRRDSNRRWNDHRWCSPGRGDVLDLLGADLLLR